MVRVKPNECSINDQEAFTTLHRQGTKFFKEGIFYGAFAGKFGNIFTFTSPEDHSTRKRLMSPSFSPSSVQDHEQLTYSCVEPVMADIARDIQSQQPVPIYPRARKFALESISAFAFRYNPVKVAQIDDVTTVKLFETFDKSPLDLLLVSFGCLLNLKLIYKVYSFSIFRW
jgi:cytochrome P450